jgi:PhnB protein
MMKMNLYLNFPGNTEEAFNFYKSVFGVEFSSLVRFKDMPMEGATIPKGAENKIMHIALPVGTDNVLMGTDAIESMGFKVMQGNNYYVQLQLDSKAEADKIFKGLSEGGSIETAMADQAWGDYYGSLTDKYGVRWMLNYTYPKSS